jgi:hypothetical protein
MSGDRKLFTVESKACSMEHIILRMLTRLPQQIIKEILAQLVVTKGKTLQISKALAIQPAAWVDMEQ